MLRSTILIYVLFVTPIVHGVQFEDSSEEHDDDESRIFLENMRTNMMGLCFEEIFATACGASTLALSTEFDVENQQIAIASTKLWANLTAIVTIQDIFRDSASSALTETMDNFLKIPQVLFHNIEDAILNNKELAGNYREEKSKAEKMQLSSLVHKDADFSVLFETNVCFREHIVRMNILLFSSAPDDAYLLLSRTILKLTKTSKRNRIQILFDEAVKITATRGTLEDVLMDDKVRMTGIGKILFSTMVELMEGISSMRSHFIEQEAEDDIINLGFEEKLL